MHKTLVLTKRQKKDITELILNGKVGIMPTDTLYGLVVRAADETAVQSLYKLKDRHSKPGTIIAASVEQLASLGLKRRYLAAVKHYWPGPVSVVIPISKHELAYLHQGVGSLAVRVVADSFTESILNKTGPLLTTSANWPGADPAQNIKQAKKYFKNTIDFYVDGGEVPAVQASTIIRVVDDAVEILRQGSVTIDETTGRLIN